MTAAELAANLQNRGIRLSVAGGRLRVEAPEGALTPQDKQALAECKGELLATLTFDVRRAGELLVLVRERLRALLDGQPIPEADLVCQAAYQRLAKAHDRRDMQAFIEAAARFGEVWRERICRR